MIETKELAVKLVTKKVLDLLIGGPARFGILSEEPLEYVPALGTPLDWEEVPVPPPIMEPKERLVPETRRNEAYYIQVKSETQESIRSRGLFQLWNTLCRVGRIENGELIIPVTDGDEECFWMETGVPAG